MQQHNRKMQSDADHYQINGTALHHLRKPLACDWVVYVTDLGPAEHFHMCFEAARAAGEPVKKSSAAPCARGRSRNSSGAIACHPCFAEKAEGGRTPRMPRAMGRPMGELRGALSRWQTAASSFL